MIGTPHARPSRAVFVAVALLLLGGVAHADAVDDLVEKLAESADYKQRLSAVATLTTDGDRRAIAAFIEALAGDKERVVRGAAAYGLGKVVTAATGAEDRKRAMSALGRAKNDKDRFVRKQAEKAFTKLEKLDDAAAAVSQGDIYVDLGPIASHINLTAPSDADLMAATQKTLAKVVRRNAKDWRTDLPAHVDATQDTAYYVDGSVDEILVKQKSGGTVLRCKVSLRIATYPDRSLLELFSSSATVSFSSTAADLEAATYDCVDAVIDTLVVKKVIPAIDGNQLGGSSGSVSSSSGSVSGSGTGWSKLAGVVPAAVSAPVTESSGWSPDGWTLLGEDEVDLIDDEVDVDRRKSTWSEVAIVVTGDAVKVNTVELGLVGKGRKQVYASIGQTFSADSQPQIIELTGKRRTIDKIRITYKKHTLDGQTRVQVWAR